MTLIYNLVKKSFINENELLSRYMQQLRYSVKS